MKPIPTLLVIVVGLATANLDLDLGISEGLAAGWKMGLRRRGLPGANLQPFGGALGGVSAPAITDSGDESRPYSVQGDSFPDFQSATDRACDAQKNDCAKTANGDGKADFTAGDCDRQNEECKSTAASATDTSFAMLTSEDADFEYFCDL